jgi:hypothetical protein
MAAGELKAMDSSSPPTQYRTRAAASAMAAAASSYFAGPAIMASQHAAAAPDNSAAASTPSPSKVCDPRFAGCAPATVRHIARSFAAAAAAVNAAGVGDPVVSMDGVDATNRPASTPSLIPGAAGRGGLEAAPPPMAKTGEEVDDRQEQRG